MTKPKAVRFIVTRDECEDDNQDVVVWTLEASPVLKGIRGHLRWISSKYSPVLRLCENDFRPYTKIKVRPGGYTIIELREVAEKTSKPKKG